MNLKEHIYSVLVVSSAENINKTLSELLPESKYSPVITVGSINAAKRAILEKSFDIIIINTPLPDDLGVRFAIDAGSKHGTVVMLLVKNEIHDEIYGKVMLHGIFTLPKPTSKQMVSHCLSWMAVVKERLRSSEKKTLSIEEKMEEIRIVNRAKWILIDELKMTEANAHHYIEKQAMDNCVSKKEVAQSIIKTYS